MLAKLRPIIRENKSLRYFIGHVLPSTGLFDRLLLSWKLDKHWRERIELVKQSPDNFKIKRVPDAGKVRWGKQVLHNGLKINVGSYYGPEKTVMLFENQGVHEPQEELIFAQVIEYLRGQSESESKMLELGSFWSFYSAWFASELKSTRNYMVEPESFNMESGKRNFALNRLSGKFINAFVSDFHELDSDDVRTICVDGLMDELKLDSLTILHSDIQGYEGKMLDGASRLLSQHACEFVFVSTHSNDIHAQCRSKLQDHGYTILSDIDLDETYSDDGLIFAISRDSRFKLVDVPATKVAV